MQDNLLFNINVEKYLKDGFYVGNVENIFDDIELFKTYSHEICNLYKDRNLRFEDGFSYRFEYSNQNNEKQKPSLKSFEEIIERENHLKTMGYHTIQRWWELGTFNKSGKYKDYFREHIHNYLIKIYPELQNNIIDGDTFTVYENGDFIQMHADGTHPERYCVVLLYLSDKKDYINGGGRLIVGDDSRKLEYIEPTNDKFVLLDFTKNNLNHAVEMVKNNFQRFTYINFISNKEIAKKLQLL